MKSINPSHRESIYVEGFSHANPVPAAAKIGPFVFSGPITGRDSQTGVMPSDLESQCANVFAHVQEIIQAAGGTSDDIIKITVWLRDFRDRDALNREWLALFPDPSNRPTRHAIAAQLDGDMRIQSDFVAILGLAT